MQIRNWSRTAMPFLALAGILAVRIAEPDFLVDAQLRAFDQLQRIQPRPYEPVGVRIVDLDDATLERFGQWPWPRTQVASLVDRLAALGARAIAFDIVFAEPDRTAPARLRSTWGLEDDPRFERLLAAVPDPDEALARSVSRAPVVTGFALTPVPGGRPPRSAAGFAHAGDDPRQFLPDYAGAVTNLPALEAAASGNGSFAIEHDRDGLIRRVPLVYRLGDQLYPSLAAEALRVALGRPTYAIRSSGAQRSQSFGARTGVSQVRIAPGFEVPTDPSGRIWLHFTAAEPDRFVPAWTVLDGSAPRERIDGHIVLVGTSATGLNDIRATPLDPAAPGVVLHAEVLEHILLDHYLSRPDWALGAEFAFIVVWGSLLALLIRRAGALWSAGLGLLGIGGAAASSWLAFEHARMLFDPVLPAAAGCAVYLAGSLTNYLHTESERSRIRGAFNHYLAPSLVKELAARPDRLRLGGETRDMTVLFADIRGFTSLSEALSPEELTHTLNSFLTPMTDRILERSGTIDKYMGDCIMSFWNAPLELAGHAGHACAAALAMVDELERVNERLWHEAQAAGRTYTPLQIGIGINSGSCCVGNMGSDQRFDYSVLGDEVNLGSRLEGQSKTYGVTIVIGENTRERAPELATFELDLIRVKGKSQPVRIHTLVGDAELACSERFKERSELHRSLLDAYRSRDFKRALELTQTCSAEIPTLAAVYTLYRDRIETHIESPPPADWDCVYTATTK